MSLRCASGFTALHFREPQLHQWDGTPPREITVTLRIENVYRASPGARNITGLGKIVDAEEYDRALIGRPLYFSALRRISVPAARSGSYGLPGVIESLPRDPAAASFEDYLENLGIHQKITRGKIMAETSPPTAFHGFCNGLEARFGEILASGLKNQI